MYKISALIACCILASCDPAKRLHIKSSGKLNSSVTLFANASVLPNNYSKSEKIQILIPQPNNSKRDTIIFYGIGTWTDDAVKALSNNIDSIIFTKASGKVSLKTKEDIFQYLLSNRSGYGKSIITINAN